MVALGQWQAQPAAVLFGDVAPDHRADVATYVRYVGGVPEARGGMLGADAVAVRGWYAEVLWGALGPNADTSPPLTPTAVEVSPTVPSPLPTPVLAQNSSWLIPQVVSSLLFRPAEPIQ